MKSSTLWTTKIGFYTFGDLKVCNWSITVFNQEFRIWNNGRTIRSRGVEKRYIQNKLPIFFYGEHHQGDCLCSFAPNWQHVCLFSDRKLYQVCILDNYMESFVQMFKIFVILMLKMTIQRVGKSEKRIPRKLSEKRISFARDSIVLIHATTTVFFFFKVFSLVSLLKITYIKHKTNRFKMQLDGFFFRFFGNSLAILSISFNILLFYIAFGCNSFICSQYQSVASFVLFFSFNCLQLAHILNTFHFPGSKIGLGWPSFW